jgi:protein-tyrosine phosphatase
MIDLHTHILPAIDDGARSLAESRELALEAAGQGVTAIVATPHVRDDFPTTADEMEEAVTALREHFAEQGIFVEILHGAEIDLSLLWAIPPDELQRLTLAQTGRYLLLEFPYRGWPLALDSAVSRLVELGICPLLAHPERNPEVQDRPDRVANLVAAGALVQVTSGSLLGHFGPSSRAASFRLLELGLVHVLASDTHGPHISREGMGAAVQTLADPELAGYLTVEVPAAIVAGEPVPDTPQVGLGA